MTRHDNNAAKKNGPLSPEQPVGNPAPRQCNDINERGIDTVNRRGRAVVEPHAAVHDLVRHEQHEERPHAVVAEALPHLGEKQCHQTARVAEDLWLLRCALAHNCPRGCLLTRFPDRMHLRPRLRVDVGRFSCPGPERRGFHGRRSATFEGRVRTAHKPVRRAASG